MGLVAALALVVMLGIDPLQTALAVAPGLLGLWLNKLVWPRSLRSMENGQRARDRVIGFLGDIYEEWPGWMTSTEDCRTWDDLPTAARAYIHRLAELADVKIEYVSVGAERDQMFGV
ncbi:MAG: hypothetical protein DWI58_20910 [Chloroflexi bacterium]|nr:MAG: hypothetical protein DWI58_20910 [Chloroflexota bacterium]